MRKNLKNKAIFQLAKMGANLWNPQSSNSQVHFQLAKIFAAYESTSRHTCAISQVHFPFSQPANQLANQVVKWGNLRINLRIPGNLKKCQPSFKSIFKPLISFIFISHNHSKLRKSPIKLRSPKFQSISSIGSPEVMRLKKKHLRAPNTHPMEHKPSNSSPFQPWPR